MPTSRVRFQYRVQQLAKDGQLPLTVVRQGAPLKIKIPVSAAHPMLIAGLQGNYPSYFIFGPMVFSRASTEFMAAPNGNPAMLGGMSLPATRWPRGAAMRPTASAKNWW